MVAVIIRSIHVPFLVERVRGEFPSWLGDKRRGGERDSMDSLKGTLELRAHS